MSAGDAARVNGNLGEIALLFVRLGATAFGGPAAHIALMEEEVVRRRGWVTREEFLDLLGATNLIPGPNSTELAIHLGHRRGGFLGLVVAGVCFILPAALATGALAALYARYGTLPAASGLLYGVKPVIIAVVIQALWNLGRTAARTWPLAALGLASAVLVVGGVSELLVLFAAGLVAAALTPARAKTKGAGGGLAAIAPLWSSVVLATPTPGAIFLLFAKIGSVLFGSGYVLLAFLRADLVVKRHWLTESQLVDAVAIGQLTPGPVFTTATFIGYLLRGPAGAAAATLGIFLPAFVFVAASGWLVPRLRRSPRTGAFLDGVNVASLALMAVVAVRLARAAVVDPLTGLLAVLAAVLLLRTKVSSVWLIVAAASVGALVYALR